MKAILSLVLLLPLALVAQTPEWKAAAAKAVITPHGADVSRRIRNREVPAESTAMELFAKTLAIEDKAREHAS
jgi:neutral ceramidase